MFVCNLLRQRLESEAKTERQEIENALDMMPVTKKFLFSVMSVQSCCVTWQSSPVETKSRQREASHNAALYLITDNNQNNVGIL